MTDRRYTYATPESLDRIGRIIAHVNANPGATSDELARAIGIPLQGIHRMTCHVERLELIHRMPNDKRVGRSGRPKTKWAAGPLPKPVKPKRDVRAKVVPSVPPARILPRLNIVHDPLHALFFGAQQKG